MDLLHACCAGLDVHKKTVVACVRTVGPDGTVGCQVRTFGTMTGELLALADWLESRGVRQVAMESTGVYGKPVWNLLEGRFELMLVNAQHIKQVPGRKTDVKDAEWIAQLLQYGLLSPSFIPEPAIRELRDLTRQRAELVRDQTAVANRIQKVLEDANIKLASVASDVAGNSGRGHDPGDHRRPRGAGGIGRAGAAAAAGQDPRADEGLAWPGHRPPSLPAARPHGADRFAGGLDRPVRRPDRSGDGAVRHAAGRLQGILGVGAKAAEVIVAELGPDLGAFPTAGHLSSWAGLCPGNNQSGGRRRSGKTTKGSQWLRTTLVQAAWAASRTEATIFSACYRRWAKRMGKKKGLVAVAHKILVVIWHLLKKGVAYREKSAPAPAA